MKLTYRHIMDGKLTRDQRTPARIAFAALPRQGGQKITLTKPDKAKAFALFVSQQKARMV